MVTDLSVAKGITNVSYADILAQRRLSPTLRGPWAAVGKTDRIQGWKLHISSIETEVRRLLECIVPVLVEANAAFKIAKDRITLGQLNEGSLGPTQVGKFMTIYPADDTQAQVLAARLIARTHGFHGPVVPSDLRLGDVVYARYGNFNPIITHDRLGQTFLSIYAPDGSLRADAYQVPFQPPDGVFNPFDDFAPSIQIQLSPYEAQPAPGKLFGPGYLFLEAIRADVKGSVFRALDLRSQENVAVKVVKQGRQFCLPDEYGRDIRTRLQRQMALHRELAPIAPVPKVDAYFEVNGNGYLPLEYIEGQTIEALAYAVLKNRTWASLSITDRIQLLRCLDNFVAAVEKVHQAGYAHRDLTASNVWIAETGDVYLLDLELTHRIGDPAPAYGMGTPGFVSPNQQDRLAPTFEDDIYAVGCVAILLLTGLDPRFVLFANEDRRAEQLLILGGFGLPELTHTVARCVQTPAAARPLLSDIRVALKCSIESMTNCTIETHPSTTRPEFSLAAGNTLVSMVLAGQDGLLNSDMLDPETGLWLSPALHTHSHLPQPNGAGSLELRRDANRGVAGVVYLLGRLASWGYGSPRSRALVTHALDLMVHGRFDHQDDLPGLHFGSAGMAMAIVEAVSGGLVALTDELKVFIQRSLNGKLDWPDITHGAAGQGVAALYSGSVLHSGEFTDLAHRCAGYLIETQQPDGSWVMPPGVDGMSGETLTGFAHGVAGIAYFLVKYADRFHSERARAAWQTAINWLAAQATPSQDGSALEWRYSDKHRDVWKWWCHGSPGIALAFLAAFELTGDAYYAQIAHKSLMVHPADLRYLNLTQCHGLSGLGEIYLEAYRVFGDSIWWKRAEQIAQVLICMRQERDNTSVWLVEDPSVATADLMVGSGGVVHFLARMVQEGRIGGFPLLLSTASK